MADRDVLELANDEEFGDGGMDDMEGEVWSFFQYFNILPENTALPFISHSFQEKNLSPLIPEEICQYRLLTSLIGFSPRLRMRW